MSDKNIENLYQAGQQESTPLALDNLILAQAKNSCGTKTINKATKRRWMYPLSTAAVVVMSFSIILNLQHENEAMMIQPSVVDMPRKEKVSLNRSIATELEAEETTNGITLTYKTKVPQKTKRISNSQPATTETKAKTQTPKTMPKTEIVNSSGLALNSQSLIVSDQMDSEQALADDLFIETIAEESMVVEPIIVQPVMSTETSEDATDTIDYNIKDDTYTHKKALEYTQSQTAPNKPQTGAMTSKERKKEKKANSPAYRLGVDLTLQIKQLDKLIEDKDFEQAKILLKTLKKSYPSYDFSKQEEILKNNN